MRRQIDPLIRDVVTLIAATHRARLPHHMPHGSHGNPIATGLHP